MAPVSDGAKVSWNMGSAFGSKLTQLGTLGVSLSEKIERSTGGNIRLKFAEPGALVPPLEMFDAISAGALDAAWSTPGYWVGKDETFAMFSAVPFGPRAGAQAGVGESGLGVFEGRLGHVAGRACLVELGLGCGVLLVQRGQALDVRLGLVELGLGAVDAEGAPRGRRPVRLLLGRRRLTT